MHSIFKGLQYTSLVWNVCTSKYLKCDAVVPAGIAVSCFMTLLGDLTLF